ncbi:hypothetical protein [Streptomyces mirabilis]
MGSETGANDQAGDRGPDRIVHRIVDSVAGAARAEHADRARAAASA